MPLDSEAVNQGISSKGIPLGSGVTRAKHQVEEGMGIDTARGFIGKGMGMARERLDDEQELRGSSIDEVKERLGLIPDLPDEPDYAMAQEIFSELDEDEKQKVLDEGIDMEFSDPREAHLDYHRFKRFVDELNGDVEPAAKAEDKKEAVERRVSRKIRLDEAGANNAPVRVIVEDLSRMENVEARQALEERGGVGFFMSVWSSPEAEVIVSPKNGKKPPKIKIRDGKRYVSMTLGDFSRLLSYNGAKVEVPGDFGYGSESSWILGLKGGVLINGVPLGAKAENIRVIKSY